MNRMQVIIDSIKRLQAHGVYVLSMTIPQDTYNEIVHYYTEDTGIVDPKVLVAVKLCGVNIMPEL